MANHLRMRVVGIPEAIELFREFAPREARNAIRSATYLLAREISREIGADANFPYVRTGVLKRSNRPRRRNSRDPDISISDAMFATGSYNGFYWRFLEHGQSNGVAMDFVRHVHTRYKLQARARFAVILAEKINKLRARR